MNERPIERLSYYNGQRLEAEDFRLEQEYHLRIQRWLSKSLFSPGVADGLEVSAIEDPQTKKKSKVLVTPGLALDDLGRAIISVNPMELVPQAPFLCVRYLERKVGSEEGSCKPQGAASQEVAHWGGPSRIFSEAEFVWRRTFPQMDTRELVIAELELAPDCSVSKVLSGPKRRAVASPPIAAPYAIAGEKDVDPENPKIIYFHAKSHSPRVFLHLRGARFSTLHYTEIPSHSHRLVRTTGTPDITISTQSAHQHDVSTVQILDHMHHHETEGNFIQLDGPALGNPDATYSSAAAGQGAVVVDMGKDAVFHRKEAFTRDRLTLSTLKSTNEPKLGGFMSADGEHAHSIWIDTSTERTGAVGGEVARVGDQLKFPGGVSISIIRNNITKDITKDILDRHLKAGHGPSSWLDVGVVSIGDSQETHPLVKDGTGAIPLHTFADFGAGENVICIRVTGGGCIHYNLYIE